MRYLAILLLAPWLLILGWAYWAYPKTLPRPWTRRLFDGLALLCAAAFGLWLALSGYDVVQTHPAGGFGPASGAVWKQVLPALRAYGGFLAALALAMILRHRVWRSRSAMTR